MPETSRHIDIRNIHNAAFVNYRSPSSKYLTALAGCVRLYLILMNIG